MLSEHRRLQLKTTRGERLEAEVNFSENPKVKDCQVIRFHINGKELDIKRDELVALLMAIGDEGMQEKLLPIKIGTTRKVERMLTFEWQATRNYAKGDTIQVKAPWIDEIPTEEELMAGKLKRHERKYAK